MKLIDEYSLQECYEQLHLLAMSYYTESDKIRKIADRIHELTRWIPVEERMPTEEDADRHGDIFIWNTARPGCLIISVNGATKSRKNDFTHWKRIDKPEAQL